MRLTRVLVAAVALCVIAAPGVARAGRVVVLDVRAEAELDDTAGAVTLLLRSAIDGRGRAVVPPPELAKVALPIDQPPALAAGMRALDAELVIACDVARSGTGLSASILAVDATGAVRAAGTAAAGEGDAVGLTRAIATVLAPTVAAMLVAGQIKLKLSGREIAVPGQQAIDALKTNNSFKPVGVALRDAPVKRGAAGDFRDGNHCFGPSRLLVIAWVGQLAAANSEACSSSGGTSTARNSRWPSSSRMKKSGANR